MITLYVTSQGENMWKFFFILIKLNSPTLLPSSTTRRRVSLELDSDPSDWEEVVVTIIVNQDQDQGQDRNQGHDQDQDQDQDQDKDDQKDNNLVRTWISAKLDRRRSLVFPLFGLVVVCSKVFKIAACHNRDTVTTVMMNMLMWKMAKICLPFSLQRQDHSTELNWQSCISDGGAHYDGDGDGGAH